MKDITTIQSSLAEADLDGWLLYDFHGLNPIAGQIAEVEGIITRRWFLLLPRQGTPRWLVHIIEKPSFESVTGDLRTYRTWQQLDRELGEMLSGSGRIAMEYSPDNAIPYVARVDAGTIEKIRAYGVEVVSSADLVARSLACWTPAQIASHHEAATALLEIKDAAFDLIARALRDRRPLSEYDVVLFIREEFAQRGMETDSGPICAVGPNAGSPHYEPTPDNERQIASNQLVLIDLWAKYSRAEAVFADITWVAYTGKDIPAHICEVFEIVARARDRAVEFINEKLSGHETVMGWEVDRATRSVIAEAGYGDRFLHRTGHSIGTDVHGIGPNIDDLETQDRRRLQEGMAFSVEPGIYLPEFGIRLEIDCLIQDNRAVVTTLPLQTDVTRLI